MSNFWIGLDALLCEAGRVCKLAWKQQADPMRLLSDAQNHYIYTSIGQFLVMPFILPMATPGLHGL